ncbi:MAG: hypothetical protein IT459_22705 [Planctomycetes bacterium]|nr:hypothetical protein [Planctomycetota bacterium]
MSSSERVPLDELEQLTAEHIAAEALRDPKAALDLAREVVALRRLLAAARITRRSLPRRLATELERFGNYAGHTRHNLAEAGRPSESDR